MAKTLPHFKWYPADAETDDFYTTLTNEELGAYHRCMNSSWLNGGIPADHAALATLRRVSRKRFRAPQLMSKVKLQRQLHRTDLRSRS